MAPRHILVTGGNGSLGRAVLRSLGDRGIAGLPHRDIADGIFVDSAGGVDAGALAGVDCIINCAGRVTGTAAELRQSNVVYPETLARTARRAGVRRFIQMSSLSIFGRVERIEVDTPLAPTSEYGRSKVAAEAALRTLDNADFRVLPLRLPFMFDADHPALLGRLVTAMRRLRMLPVSVAEPCRRSMITYGGAADALMALALAKDLPTGDLAAADRVPLDLRTIATAVGDQLGTTIRIVPLPRPVLAIAGRIAPGVADRIFRSSILAPPANTLGHAIRHSVATELSAYLDHIAADVVAGQRGAS